MLSSFRTIVNINQFPFAIDHNSPSLFLGSCFTDNIGAKMVERKFPAMVNPFGVVYNPLSVAGVLERIVKRQLYTDKELHYHNDFWLSFDHHTSFSKIIKDDCLTGINKSLTHANEFWHKAENLLLTFGTARVYRYKNTQQIVANCHKIPAKEFYHELFSVDDIVRVWRDLLNRLIEEKPNLKVFLTVSPVRHWKDGAAGNQTSKATLLLAVSQLESLFPNNVHYFPAYEIMMDDLRDYRFYADDMLHPSSIAVDYIWEKFRGALISSDSQKLSEAIAKINRAIKHRPFNVNAKEHQLFVQSTLSKINELQSLNPEILFTEEIAHLNSLLNNE